MSAPPPPPPGQGPNNKSGADKEAEMRAQAVMQAMMDDLGNNRQDNLPLDDKPKYHDRGNNFRPGRRAYIHGFPAPPPARRAQPQPHGQGGGMGWSQDDARSSQPQPRGNGGGVGWSLDGVWKAAMSAGAFDDEDAHGVKGLNDLGGGRLYDNTGGGGLSQRERVTGKTMKILEHRDKRSAFQFSQQPIPNKKIRTNEPSGGHRSVTVNIAHQQQNRAVFMQPASRDASISSGSRRQQPNANPKMRPKLPRPQPMRPLDLPMPVMDIDPNTPLPFEIPNILLKINVKFLSRDINPALPSLVVLSAAKPPQLGFFTVVLFSRKFCEWPISAWSDYSTGAQNQLGMSFRDGHSSFQGYQLHFNEEKELVQFMDLMRALKDGKHANEVGSTPAPDVGMASSAKSTPAPIKSTPAPVKSTPSPGPITPAPVPRVPAPVSTAPTPAPRASSQVPQTPAPAPRAPRAPRPVFKAPAPVPTASTPVSQPPAPAPGAPTPAPKTPAPVPTKTTMESVVPTKGKSIGSIIPPADVQKPQAVRQTTQTAAGPTNSAAVVGQQALASITNGVAPPANRASGTHLTPKAIDNPSQKESQDGKTTKPVHDTLINLDKDDESVADSHHPSEATDLLSTLDPHDFSRGLDCHTSPADHVSREEIVDTARHLLNFFLLTGTGGKAETLAQVNEMAEGVRSGVLEHMIKDARAQGFRPEQLEEIRGMVNSVFAALIAAKQKSLPGHNDPRASRVQYTVLELMAMRDGAVQPSSFLFEVPKPGDGPRQARGSPRGRSFSQPSPKPRTTFDQSQAAKSANAMQWALGAVEGNLNSKAPEGEPKKAEGTKVAPARPGDSGLQSSRWASYGAEIKHANYFTGPAYERTWSKRSYLEDLAQLDPHAKITAGAEDLVDLHFPMPKDEETRPIPAASRVPDQQGKAPPHTPSRFSSKSGPDTPVTEMENLEVRMARLSLLSPTGPKFTPASGEDEPSTSAAANASGRLSGVLGSDQASGSAEVVASGRPTIPELMPSRARQSQSQPKSFIVPPPRVASRPAASPAAAQIIKGLRAMNGSPSPIPARTSSLPAAQAAPPAQKQATVAGSEKPAVLPPAQPTMRGLGASRHSSGAVLTSAGKFNHHVAGSGRK